jgi:hypothetical protein
MVQNEALEGNATWQANISKNLGKKMKTLMIIFT